MLRQHCSEGPNPQEPTACTPYKESQLQGRIDTARPTAAVLSRSTSHGLPQPAQRQKTDGGCTNTVQMKPIAAACQFDIAARKR